MQNKLDDNKHSGEWPLEQGMQEVEEEAGEGGENHGSCCRGQLPPDTQSRSCLFHPSSLLPSITKRKTDPFYPLLCTEQYLHNQELLWEKRILIAYVSTSLVHINKKCTPNPNSLFRMFKWKYIAENRVLGRSKGEAYFSSASGLSFERKKQVKDKNVLQDLRGTTDNSRVYFKTFWKVK